VYADNDPIVLAHARALLTSSPEGETGYLEADIKDPNGILAGAAELIDFTRPVAVMLVPVLHMLGRVPRKHGHSGRSGCPCGAHGPDDPRSRAAANRSG
jgi:hypothetical protein